MRVCQHQNHIAGEHAAIVLQTICPQCTSWIHSAKAAQAYMVERPTS